MSSFVFISETAYFIEEWQLIKYAPFLNQKSLFPSNLERQNVKLALNIFRKTVKEGLLHYGKLNNLPNYKDTGELIEIITNWWTVVNVKTVCKGIWHNNPLENPLNLNNEAYIFLNQCADSILRWKAMKDSGNECCLSKETMRAINHSTKYLLEIAKYCINHLVFHTFYQEKYKQIP